MPDSQTNTTPVDDDNLQDMVNEADTGARRPYNPLSRAVLLYTAFSWTIFQLWIASPLQFYLGVFILNDTQTRSIHLAFAVFLAFLALWGGNPHVTISRSWTGF